MDVQLAAEAKLEGAQKAGAFQLLAPGHDALQGLVWPDA